MFPCPEASEELQRYRHVQPMSSYNVSMRSIFVPKSEDAQLTPKPRFVEKRKFVEYELAVLRTKQRLVVRIGKRRRDRLAEVEVGKL